MLCIFSHMIMNSTCQCVFELLSAQIPALAPLSVLCTRISAIRCWTWPLIKLTPVRHASKYSPHIKHIKTERMRGVWRRRILESGRRELISAITLSRYHHSYVHESTCQKYQSNTGNRGTGVNWEQDARCQNMTESRRERLEVS